MSKQRLQAFQTRRKVGFGLPSCPFCQPPSVFQNRRARLHVQCPCPQTPLFSTAEKIASDELWHCEQQSPHGYQGMPRIPRIPNLVLGRFEPTLCCRFPWNREDRPPSRVRETPHSSLCERCRALDNFHEYREMICHLRRFPREKTTRNSFMLFHSCQTSRSPFHACGDSSGQTAQNLQHDAGAERINVESFVAQKLDLKACITRLIFW